MSDSVRPHRRQPTKLPRPWDSPGKNTGVGCHFLLQTVKVKSLSHVRLLATPWTAAYQAPPSVGFSRQEYWSGVPLPSPLITMVPPKMNSLLTMWKIPKGTINIFHSPNSFKNIYGIQSQCCNRHSYPKHFKPISSSGFVLKFFFL